MSFSPVRILENRPAARDLHHIVVDLGSTGIERGYALPGQFVQLALGEGKPGFYAIASPPDPAASKLEFLIKNDGETSEAICALAAGAACSSSNVMGKGFPLERAAGRPLVILCNGSGISAVRAVVEHGLSAHPEVHLYASALTCDRLAYQDRHDAWRAAGVQIHISIDDDPTWAGATGYVQDLATSSPPFDLATGSAVLVGVPPMLAAAKERLGAAGMPSDQILVNF